MTDYEEQDDVYDDISLKNKNVEPDKRHTEFASRNLQLGNIEKRELRFLWHRSDRLMKYDRMPHRHGGWLTKKLANEHAAIINLQLITSGSVGGFVREINATSRKINDNRLTEFKGGKIDFSRRT